MEPERFRSVENFILNVMILWQSLLRNTNVSILGNEVRLMNAYFVTCTGYEADDDGTIRVVHCTYDPETKGGNAPDGRKVKGTIHWVEASNAGKVEVRLYENIVDEEKGVYNKEDGSLNVNPNSLTVNKCLCRAGASESKRL